LLPVPALDMFEMQPVAGNTGLQDFGEVTIK
jgi:hypothetical protein